MATYIELTNRVLKRLNEVQLTSNNFVATTTNFQAMVKDTINAALKDIYNESREWPFTIRTGIQVLTPGTQTYTLPATHVTVDWESFFIRPSELIQNGNFTSPINQWTNLSTGTGTVVDGPFGMELNGGTSGEAKATQSFSTIKGKRFRVQIRTFQGDLVVKIGTTSDGSEYLQNILTYTEFDAGQYYELAFMANGPTAYITFSNTVNEARSVRYLSIFEDMQSRPLDLLDFDKWRALYRDRDNDQDPRTYTMPLHVFRTQDNKFGVSGKPDRAYTVFFDYWEVPADLELPTDETIVPDKYEYVIIDGAMYYCYLFRDNVEQIGMARDKFQRNLKRMRADLIPGQTHMTARPVAVKKSRHWGF